MPFASFQNRQIGSIRETVWPCAKEHRNRTWKAFLRIAGLFLLVMAGMCGNSNTACGSCGDYVLTSSKPHHPPAMHSDLGGLHLGSQNITNLPPQPTEQPCRGPHCQKQSLPPWIPVTTQPQPNQEEAVSLANVNVPAFPSCQQLTLKPPSKPDRLSKQRVERPPRPVA